MADNSRYLTPPVYAKKLRVNADKVLSWIRKGELRAVDVSERPGTGRPRWRISPDAIAEFENRRAPTVPVKRRRRSLKTDVLDIIS